VNLFFTPLIGVTFGDSSVLFKKRTKNISAAGPQLVELASINIDHPKLSAKRRHGVWGWLQKTNSQEKEPITLNLLVKT
jgi:hypothetical protein